MFNSRFTHIIFCLFSFSLQDPIGPKTYLAAHHHHHWSSSCEAAPLDSGYNLGPLKQGVLLLFTLLFIRKVRGRLRGKVCVRFGRLVTHRSTMCAVLFRRRITTTVIVIFLQEKLWRFQQQVACSAFTAADIMTESQWLISPLPPALLSSPHSVTFHHFCSYFTFLTHIYLSFPAESL